MAPGAQLHGWARPAALDAYERERQPITEQVSQFAMNHAQAMIKARRGVPRAIEETQIGCTHSIREKRMKIIDCHAHMAVPHQLAGYKASLLSHRGAHGRKAPPVSDDAIRQAFTRVEMAPVGHLQCLADAGVDMQIISPRPFQLMHSEEPKKLVHWYVEYVNDIIAQECALYPGSLRRHRRPAADRRQPDHGGARRARALREDARLPRLPDQSRSVRERRPQGAADGRPLLVSALREALRARRRRPHPFDQLALPEREPYSLHFINEETTAVYGLCRSTVLDDFPTLKILVSHGGGAIPFQIGRFDATSVPRNGMR